MLGTSGPICSSEYGRGEIALSFSFWKWAYKLPLANRRLEIPRISRGLIFIVFLQAFGPINCILLKGPIGIHSAFGKTTIMHCNQCSSIEYKFTPSHQQLIVAQPQITFLRPKELSPPLAPPALSLAAAPSRLSWDTLSPSNSSTAYPASIPVQHKYSPQTEHF